MLAHAIQRRLARGSTDVEINRPNDPGAGMADSLLEELRADPDVLKVDGRYEIAGNAGAPIRRMWTSFVMVQTGGSWRIAAIRNMLPAPPAK